MKNMSAKMLLNSYAVNAVVNFGTTQLPQNLFLKRPPIYISDIILHT